MSFIIESHVVNLQYAAYNAVLIKRTGTIPAMHMVHVRDVKVGSRLEEYSYIGCLDIERSVVQHQWSPCLSIPEC